MKLAVMARTRNEEDNVERFIKSYGWVDNIIIVDGGSSDKTVEMATFLGAKVFTFTETVEHNFTLRNPHGQHLNFGIRLAESYNSDWIIHDDIDCVPNKDLQKHGRRLLEESKRDFIYVTRAYLYKDKGYASKMSLVGDEWQQSLWAWRTKGFRFSENDPFEHTFTEPADEDIWRIKPPIALLHRPWPTDETIDRKRRFYDKIYNRKTNHPLEYCGKIKSLEWWMK